MKQLKFCLLVLGTAAYTSSWWAAAIWGSVKGFEPLWIFPVIATLGAALAGVAYLCDHWND